MSPKTEKVQCLLPFKNFTFTFLPFLHSENVTNSDRLFLLLFSSPSEMNEKQPKYMSVQIRLFEHRYQFERGDLGELIIVIFLGRSS